MSNFDFKKEYRDLYVPKSSAQLTTLPKMKFIMVAGKGDPNEIDGAYAEAIGLLYALSYTLKMSVRNGKAIDGYFPYVVPPLEGLWWSDDVMFDVQHVKSQKHKFCWYAMIRQPDFVTEDAFAWACQEVKRKKGLDIDKARFQTFEEGLCVQIMHTGSYDDEPVSFAKMSEFMEKERLVEENRNLPNLLTQGVHHEIYLSDPRKGKPENRKTVLRKQVKLIDK